MTFRTYFDVDGPDVSQLGAQVGEQRAAVAVRLSRVDRVVAVLSIIKEPGREINYGRGKDVTDESIADDILRFT